MSYIPQQALGAFQWWNPTTWFADDSGTLTAGAAAATGTPVTSTGIQSVPSSGGDVGACTPPQTYNAFYNSCVDPCPKDSFGRTQHYDPGNGYCVPDQGLSTMAMVGIGVGVVAGYMLIFGKKKRRKAR